jgi:GNAT superfamily N-acetyltransferase
MNSLSSRFKLEPFQENFGIVAHLASEKELRAQWRRSDGLSGWARWTVLDDESIVAVITFGPYPNGDGKGFWVAWAIDRMAPRLELFEFLETLTMDAAARAEANQIVFPVNANEEEKCEFLRARGYSVARRGILMKLTLETTPGYCIEATWPQTGNIVIRPLAELDPSKVAAGLYALEQELDRDIPNMENVPKRTLEEFVRHRLTGADVDYGCVFVAFDGNHPVGMCAARPRGDDLHIGMTGVRRSHRGLGLAKALKEHLIHVARRKGFKTVTAKNDAANEPILALNRQMGFVPAIDIIEFVKEVHL